MGCGASASGGGGESKGADTTSGQKPTKKEKEAANNENLEYEQAMKFLTNVPLFKRLPASEHPLLAGGMVKKTHAAGTTIIKQGDPGNEFFVIAAGEATVHVSTGNDEKEVGALKLGDYFGEGAVLKEVPRAATVRTKGELTTYSITREKFRELQLPDKLMFAKRQAVLAVTDEDQDSGKAQGPTEKNQDEKDLITKALKSNNNLNALVSMDDERVSALVEVAWKLEVASGTDIIVEGDSFADYFYVVQAGEFEVLLKKDEAKSAEEHAGETETVANLKAGDSFGELALLYYAPRAATVKATSKATVWVIGRQAFKSVLLKASDAKIAEYSKILDSVVILDGLLSDEKKAIAEALVEMHFHKGEIILQEGEMGSTFFILYDGEVSVKKGSDEISSLSASSKEKTPQFFGERALLKNEARAATISVTSTTAKALALDRESFEMLLGPLEDILTQNEQKQAGGGRKSMAPGKGPGRKSFFPSMPQAPGATKIDRRDLKRLGLLGCGGFGMVTLEEHKQTQKTFALKALSKGYIVKTGMQASVMNEKRILSMTDSVFIVKLFETYKGQQSLYFLLEPCLGGELYATYHRKSLHGSEAHAKFYIASVICAFEHLHERRVIYRDLKPENVLLDSKGYAKLTDMGLAKFVIGRTYTTCGTPDYFAPEVIASTGHSRGVDWWTLGILIFELMTGHPPFESSDPMGTYMKVMQGIEKVRFPHSCAGAIEQVVKELCKKEPSERLPMRTGGLQKLKAEGWLSGFSFQALIDQTMDTPYKPKVKGVKDLANFSAREEDAPRQIKYTDDGSGWDADF